MFTGYVRMMEKPLQATSNTDKIRPHPEVLVRRAYIQTYSWHPRINFLYSAKLKKG
jgi:hypothetical protein